MHGAIAARAEHGIACSLVRCSASATEIRGRGRISFSANPKAARRPVRIRKVGMVKNVEELRPELGGEPFLEFKLFGYGQIPIAETGVTPNVTARCAEGSWGGGDQDRLTLEVAPNSVELGYCRGVNSVRGLETCIRGSCDLTIGQRHRIIHWG